MTVGRPSGSIEVDIVAPDRIVVEVELEVEARGSRQQLEKLVKLMDYDALRKEQRSLRERGVFRGIGIATAQDAFDHKALDAMLWDFMVGYYRTREDEEVAPADRPVVDDGH